MKPSGIEPADVGLIAEEKDPGDGTLEPGDFLDGLLRREVRSMSHNVKHVGKANLSERRADGFIDVWVGMLEAVVVVRWLDAAFSLPVPRRPFVPPRTGALLRMCIFRRHAPDDD